MMTQVKLAPDQMALLRRQLGLDDPLLVRLGNYLADLLKGDLGVSFFGYHPVLRLIRENFPATLELTVAAMGVAVILGLPLGMIAALRHNTWLDLSGMTVALIGISIPGFWLGLMMIQFFSVQFGWLPITGNGLRPLIMP